MKRSIAILLVLMLMLSALAGCGASSAGQTAAPEASASMPMPETMAEEEMGMDAEMPQDILTGGAFIPADAAQRKLIKTVDLQLETREFDTATQQLLELVEELGGYVEYSDVSGRSLYNEGDYYSRWANYTVRVPEEKLEEATQTISEICNVASRSESVSDITDTYYDTEGRLKSLRIQEERLLAMMEQATVLEDMLTIEAHLSEVRYQIEALTGELKHYDSQVNYATIHINLQEVVEYTRQRQAPVSFGERIGNAFENSLSFIGQFGENLVIGIVSVLPVLLVYGGAALILVLIILKIVRTAKKRRAARRLAGQQAAAQRNDPKQGPEA